MKKILIILTTSLFVLSGGMTVGAATSKLENTANDIIEILGGPPFGNIPTED